MTQWLLFLFCSWKNKKTNKKTTHTLNQFAQVYASCLCTQWLSCLNRKSRFYLQSLSLARPSRLACADGSCCASSCFHSVFGQFSAVAQYALPGQLLSAMFTKHVSLLELFLQNSSNHMELGDDGVALVCPMNPDPTASSALWAGLLFSGHPWWISFFSPAFRLSCQLWWCCTSVSLLFHRWLHLCARPGPSPLQVYDFTVVPLSLEQ